MEGAVALTRFEELVLEDLPPYIRDYQPARKILKGNTPDELVPLEEIERQYIQEVLNAVGGNKSTAARILGLGRRTLYRKIDQWNL